MLFAFRVGVDIHDDTAILRWARRHQCILVCHDKHRDSKTRLELFPEVYRNGGQILRIAGRPDQDPLVSVGKVLVHIEEWREFFAHSDGTFLVAKCSTLAIPPDKMLAQVQGTFDMDRATGRKMIKPSPRRKRQPKESPGQIHMATPSDPQ